MNKFDYDPRDFRVRLEATYDDWHTFALAYEARGKTVHLPKDAFQRLLNDQQTLLKYHRGEVKDVPE